MTQSTDEILTIVSRLLLQIMEEDPEDIEIELHTSFQNDLELESIEMVALGDLLTEEYGDVLDFAGWLTQLDMDALMNLTVGHLVEWIEQCLSP